MAVLFLEDQEFLRVEQDREHRRFTGTDGIDRQTIFFTQLFRAGVFVEHEVFVEEQMDLLIFRRNGTERI